MTELDGFAAFLPSPSCSVRQSEQHTESAGSLGDKTAIKTTVVDPDPYVFGPSGSGSFHHQAKIARKPLISTGL
jgi:hypothetical protein